MQATRVLSFLGLDRRRKLKFDVSLSIHELTEIPLSNASIYVKCSLPSGKVNQKKKTERRDIREHVVRWNETFKFPCTLYVDSSTNILDSCTVTLVIKQERPSGKGGKRLGRVFVDLAQHASVRQTTRKYLLQDANFNSALKVTVTMQQLSGGPMFKCPKSEANKDMWLQEHHEESERAFDILAGVDIPNNRGSADSASRESRTPIEPASRASVFMPRGSAVADYPDTRISSLDVVDDLLSSLQARQQQHRDQQQVQGEYVAHKRELSGTQSATSPSSLLDRDSRTSS
eukprot:GILJ01003255.1.p1 GENE.GILJ01003255.1~~GILJ01003255.1.p1  ORF type:complete len:288 (+),score=25.26 GILJ01003255.1:76-939(+)